MPDGQHHEYRSFIVSIGDGPLVKENAPQQNTSTAIPVNQIPAEQPVVEMTEEEMKKEKENKRKEKAFDTQALNLQTVGC